MIGELTEAIQEPPTEQDLADQEEYGHALQQIVPFDEDDEFCLGTSLARSTRENPIAFFENVFGHLEMHPLPYYWEELLSVESNTSFRQYIDAKELAMPHLSHDILTWIIFITRGQPGMPNWEYTTAQVIENAREHFVNVCANRISARARMGINDLKPQSGFISSVNRRVLQVIDVCTAIKGGFDKEAWQQHLPPIAGLIEDISWFIADCAKCTKPMDYATSLYRFFKSQLQINLTASCSYWLVEYVDSFVKDLEDMRVSQRLSPQAGFGEFVETYKCVTQSQVFEKFTKLAMLLGSLAMCFMSGQSLSLEAFKEVCKTVYSGLKATDIMGQILEAIQAIYHKCIPVLFGQASFSSIWMGLGDGKQLDLDIISFSANASRYIEGTMGPHDTPPEIMLVNVDVIIDKLMRMIKATASPTDRLHLRRTVIQLETLRQGVNNRYDNSGMRNAPYTVSLSGTSGVGKTAFLSELSSIMQRCMKLPAGFKRVFRMDENDNYQSDLTSEHNVYIIDDYGNTKPQFAKTVPTDTIVMLVNNCPKFAVKADIAAKGAVPMRPHFVFITTNVKELQAAVYSECAESILRRPNIHVTMRVKSEYADVNGRLRKDVDPYVEKMDCWIYTVEYYSPNDPNQVRGFVAAKKDGKSYEAVDFCDLIRFMVADAKAHHARQDVYVARSKNAHLSELCECEMPRIFCNRCPQLDTPLVEQLVPPIEPEPQAGYLDDKIKLVNRALGVREVLRHPLGRELIAEELKEHVVLGSLFLLAMSLKLPVTAAIWLWMLAILVYMVTAMYRVLTYSITHNIRNVVQRCVSNVRDQYLGPKAKVVAAFVAAAAVYKAYDMVSKLKPQGSMPSRPRVEVELGPVPDNWRRNELTPIKNASAMTSTGKQLAEVLERKLSTLKLHNEDGVASRFVATVPVCTNFWLAPAHLPFDSYTHMSILTAGEDVINNGHSGRVSGAWRRIRDSDYALIYMPSMGDQKDIRNFFPNEQFCNPQCKFMEKPCRVVVLHNDKKKVEGTDKWILVPRKSTHCVRVNSDWVTPVGVDKYWGGAYVGAVDTFEGMCGAPIVTEGSGPFIVGLHSAGYVGTKHGSYSTVTREALQECLDVMTAPDKPMMQGSEETDLLLDSVGMPFKHELPKNTHFAFMQEAEVDLLGSHAGRKRRYTTMVKETEFSNDVLELFGVERKHGPPALINHWYPPRLWAESCANAKPVSLSSLTMAYQDYRTGILEFLQEEHKKEIFVLEDVANVSGVDGVKGYYKINLNASAGIPYGKPKSEFVQASKEFFDGITVPYELTDDMMADVKTLEDIYKSGKRGYAPHRANRKDEAIKIGKAKVRIFSGTNMPYLFLMRKYFLSISAFMQKHPEVFESAVGINPYSAEWTKLRNFIASKGEERIIAGDYVKYDQFVHSSLTYAGFKILIEIAEWAGYDEEDLMVMRGLATDTCNPLYELDGLWLKCGGSSPSGHGLTVVINGLVGSFYARIAYYDLLYEYLKKHGAAEFDQGITSFRKHVALMTYGDDNVMSVSEAAHFFTHTTYQAALKKYGLDYTMAEKEAESVPYIAMDQATFLKRSWVYSEKHKRYYAPLEKDSIFKMLHTYNVSKKVEAKQQLADILRAANQEFYMHGDETFVSARDKLEQIASKHELHHYMADCALPSLQEMDAWFGDM